MPDQVPPGRAGRLWLRSRLETARRGMELLDRKRQLLRREHGRLLELRSRSERRWESSCVEAQRWGLRAAILGGTSQVSLSTSPLGGRARADIVWTNTMGVRHPDDPRASLPVIAGVDAAAANSAVAPAAAAYRRALEAGVEHAAAAFSCDAVGAELSATERRLRAIERYRVPALEDALRRLELRLDELEREERVVTRWARGRRGPEP